MFCNTYARFELVAERNFAEEKKEFYTDKLLEAASKRIAGADSSNNDDSEEKYRKMEYDAILGEAGGENQDFFVTKNQSNIYDDSETGGAISNCFTSIGLLHKLRETRAFVGFSRWLPDDGKTLTEKKNFIKLGQRIEWLPAVVVRGEGVFFEFNEKRLKEWAAKDEIKKKAKFLSDNYNRPREAKGLKRMDFRFESEGARVLVNAGLRISNQNS